MSLEGKNKVLKVPTAVNSPNHLIDNKLDSMNHCEGVIQVLSNEWHEVFRKTLSLANVISIFGIIGEAFLWARCHAPNRFGTVNMEDNVYIKRS